jgi:hypothetical protein
VTWAKYGVEFFDQCADAGLTAEATLTHAEAIAWLYRCDRADVMDVSIPAKAIRKFANCEDPAPAIADLVRVGFWAEGDGGYVLVHHAEVVSQSLTSQRIKRDVNRRSQRKARAAQNMKPGAAVSTDGDADGGIASNKQTEQPNTDVGSQEKRPSQPAVVPWPDVAPVGAGLPESPRSGPVEPTDRCLGCEKPIIVVDSPYHPGCDPSVEEIPV